MVPEEPQEPEPDGRSTGILERTLVRRAIISTFIAMTCAGIATNPVIAQSATEMAASFCTSPVYNFLLACVYIGMGVVSATILGSIAAGSGMRSLGWLSRSIGKRGGKAIMWGAVAFALMAAALVLAGIAYSTLPAEAPSQCVVFFGS